jgi:uncharacterized protein (TIGR01777 family)
MNILITGGTGFIGSALTKFFIQKGYLTTILSRNCPALSSVRIIKSIEQINVDEKIDIIINLAGAPINKKWTNSYKEVLIDSRLEITKNLILLIKSLKTKPNLLISASAIGYYGNQSNNYIDENSLYINDFTHKLCNLWELEAKKAEKLGVRTCITRLGVVLGKNGGALEEMLPIFRLGLGAKIGSGKQFFSWVHIDDVIGAFNFLIKDKTQKGIYNLTSPNPVTNYRFTKELGKMINRPTVLTIPKFVIKMIFGEMGDKLLLNGSAVYPKKLLDSGYEFQFKTIEASLENILK